MSSILSTADLGLAARRRLPRSLYGYVNGGAEDQAALAGNRAAFGEWAFLPRMLTGVAKRSQQTRLFGRLYAAPLGISPIGAASLCRFDADRLMARAAHAANLPFILSGASTTPLEWVAEVNPDTWFQAYIPSDRTVIEPLLARVAAARISTLVVTVDVPLAATREIEQRNGFSLPLRLSPSLVFGGMVKPRWALETFVRTLLRNGVPHFENFSATRGASIIAVPGADHRSGRAALNWHDLRWLRDRWHGRLVIKGILRVDDALRAQELGADGIIVSNHGGRQLDGAVAPLAALPPIVAAADKLTIMIDSGFRRGTDVIKAVALGARFVFVGRPAIYGAACAGQAGVARALAILKNEIDINLALLGCAAMADLSPHYLVARRSAQT